MLAYGGIDVLVASAGLATSAPITETTLADWELNFAVLARGYFLAARETFRVLLEQGRGGSIVFVGSKNALVGGANAAAYSSAKAASLHLARCLAEEGGAHGIRVNTVNPDAVIEGSGIWSSDWKAERASTYGIDADDLPAFYRGRTRLGVNVYADDVAEAIAFFAGPRSAKSTGNILNVDGGVPAAYTALKGGARPDMLDAADVPTPSFPERKEPEMQKKRSAVRSIGALLASVAVASGRAPARRAAELKEGQTVYFIPKDTLNPYEVIADRGGKIALTAHQEQAGRLVGHAGHGRGAAAVDPGRDPVARERDRDRRQRSRRALPVAEAGDGEGHRGRLVRLGRQLPPALHQPGRHRDDRAQPDRSCSAKLMSYKGEFAILSAASTATNQNAWIKYMKLELKKPSTRT